VYRLRNRAARAGHALHGRLGQRFLRDPRRLLHHHRLASRPFFVMVNGHGDVGQRRLANTRRRLQGRLLRLPDNRQRQRDRKCLPGRFRRLPERVQRFSDGLWSRANRLHELPQTVRRPAGSRGSPDFPRCKERFRKIGRSAANSRPQDRNPGAERWHRRYGADITGCRVANRQLQPADQPILLLEGAACRLPSRECLVPRTATAISSNPFPGKCAVRLCTVAPGEPIDGRPFPRTQFGQQVLQCLHRDVLLSQQGIYACPLLGRIVGRQHQITGTIPPRLNPREPLLLRSLIHADHQLQQSGSVKGRICIPCQRGGDEEGRGQHNQKRVHQSGYFREDRNLGVLRKVSLI